ncbi:MAG: hypothetical protein PHP86_12430 [Nevskiales bacterium]|nr:hypothetical protein [Nevskiales bacterium]
MDQYTKANDWRSRSLIALTISLAALLGACSNGGDDNSDGGGGTTAKSCQDSYNPELQAAGEDCTPQYGVYCPDSSGSVLNSSEATPCDGVNIAEGSVEVNGMTSDFLVLTPSGNTSKAVSGTYLALHWAEANAPTMVDRMRLGELAKARNLRVIVPTAPGPVRSWGNSVVIPLNSVDQRIAILDAVLAQADGISKAGGSLIVGGVSGGGILAFQYACARAPQVTGSMIVAAEIRSNDLASCQPAGPFASVQVHGTADLIAPYMAVPILSAGADEIFQTLYENNGCNGDNVTATSASGDSNPLISDIEVKWVKDGCTSGKGSSLITVQNGGHNWPGYSGPLELPANLYGPTADGFDATLQGYDLIKYLGG